MRARPLQSSPDLAHHLQRVQIDLVDVADVVTNISPTLLPGMKIHQVRREAGRYLANLPVGFAIEENDLRFSTGGESTA
jgi:hypothetical protein